MWQPVPVSKLKTKYACSACGFVTPKWLGKCPDCQGWNTFAEELTSSAHEEREKIGYYSLGEAGPVALDDVSLAGSPRYSTHISELDRVLGGGIVPGSLVLLGGDPGIGKSTLILQTLDRLLLNSISVLYVTGEESKEQIKLRAQRLNVKSNITLLAENSLDKILSHAERLKPQILVVDSIQTVYLPHLESAPGSVTQVRESAGKLLYYAKSSGCAAFLIGHVTKEGALAGPRTLEHMVDTVLYFEGENTGQFRYLRTMKNRYGSTNEIGVFEMTAAGLTEVTNPSEHFLRDKHAHRVGSCVTASVEGTRPILMEIQSLVSSSPLANPRRTAIGLDYNRVNLIVAVLEKCVGLNLYTQDIFVSAAGGLRVTEPACDLAVLMSLTSSYQNKPIPANAVAIGEVGLGGEIRPVSSLDARLNEAMKLGYHQVILAKNHKIGKTLRGLELLAYASVEELISQLF